MKTIKKISILSVISFFIFATNVAFAQTAEKKIETFKVYGNCGMCKETIEGALKKKDGVLKKNWNVETKMVTVTYDASKITLKQIKQNIANAGYDTDEVRAKDETYSKLHGCCQYDRPKNKL